MHLAFIFGRTPQLSRQELESVATILPFQWSLISVQPNIVRLKPEDDYADLSILKDGVESEELLKVLDKAHSLQQWLGGTMKIILLEQATDRNSVVLVAQKLITTLQSGGEGKRTVGVSIYTKSIDPFRTAMQLKKGLRAHSPRGIRMVTPSTGGELSSAQILHNHLALATENAGFNCDDVEVNVIPEDGKFWVGVTIASQDIDAYTKRDFGIPKPDPVSGMLPPKLAQAMVNLAAQAENVAVYDPFCGNGRVLMEASMNGILQAYGSDIVPKKVESALENLAWLEEQVGSSGANTVECWVADATALSTPSEFREHCPEKDYVIVGEPYLGKPLRAILEPKGKDAWLAEVLPLYESFLTTWSVKNLPEKDRPKRMLLVFPSAKMTDGTEASVYDSLVDSIDRLGYDSKRCFTYDRPDSFVRRDLISLQYR